MHRLAIITSHPIQYYAPWFRHLARERGLVIRVFYLDDFGVRKGVVDPGFGVEVQWDIPLLDGYDHEFVENLAPRPGTSHFMGLVNPTLRRQVLGWKPDAVLLMTYRYRSVMEFIVRSSSRVPLIFRGDSHRLGANLGGFGQAIRRLGIGAVFSRFAAVLPVGKANAEYFRIHGVPTNRMFVCPHCIDVDRMQEHDAENRAAASKWRAELGIPPEHRVVLYAGKFIECKRVDDLIRAFRRTDGPATLLLVGAGPLEASLRELATGDDRIKFAPFQNQSAMPWVLAASDVVVLPSASETWGLILNEAMAVGRGIIASDRVGGAPDLIVPDRNGAVFPVGDVEALAGILARVVSEPGLTERWGSESLERSRDFTYIQATEGLMRALDFVHPAGAGPP